MTNATLSPIAAPYFDSICEAVDSDARAYEIRVRGEYMLEPRTVLIDSEDRYEDDLFHMVEVLADLGIIEPCDPDHADAPQWHNGECYDRSDLETMNR